MTKCRLNRNISQRSRLVVIVCLFVTSTLFWLKVSIVIDDEFSNDITENQLIASRSVCEVRENDKVSKQSPSGLQLMGKYFEDMTDSRPPAKFLIQPEINIQQIDAKDCEKAAKTKWTIVNFVKSAVRNPERRNVIRSTWGALQFLDGIRLEVIFIVGRSPADEGEDELRRESEKYGDILQTDVEDSAASVPLKVLAGMQWSSENLPADWVYSSLDDDVVLHVINILTYLNSLVDPMGSIKPTETDLPCPEKLPLVCIYSYKQDDPPARNKDSKWHLSYEDYPNKTLPVYCRGGMYSASNKMVSQLFQVSKKTPFLYLDDVWITGFMRLKLRNKDVDILGAPHAHRTNNELLYDWKNSKNVLIKHLFGNYKQFFFSPLVDVEKNLRLTYADLKIDFTQHDVCFKS